VEQAGNLDDVVFWIEGRHHLEDPARLRVADAVLTGGTVTSELFAKKDPDVPGMRVQKEIALVSGSTFTTLREAFRSGRILSWEDLRQTAGNSSWNFKAKYHIRVRMRGPHAPKVWSGKIRVYF
jgi:hypothetical protein